MTDTYFDEEAADHVCEFFSRYLILPETGTPFVLEPWQRDMLRHVFGTKNADSTRLIRTLYLEVPKKQGKSALSSGCALYLLCADQELSGETYSVAADRFQASIVFDAAKKMVQASPRLSKIIKPYRYTLIHQKSGSKYAVLSADAHTKEGIKASGVLFDEIHIQPDRKLWDTLRGSGLARKQPLTIVTTTAGDNRNSIGWEIHDYALRVRDGKHADPTFYPVIFAADEADDPENPEVWRKANPSLGVTISERDFRARYEEAAGQGPAALSSWKRYHLNIWAESASAFLPMDKWDAIKAPVNPAALFGKPCHIGVDLSATTDLTATTLLFPSEDGGYQVLAYAWMPRANVIEAERRDKVPYRSWADQGFLELTDGSAIDYAIILRRILELNEKHPFVNREVAIDIYNAWELNNQLTANGLTPVVIPQTAKGLSAPSKELLRLVIGGKFYHGCNPLFTQQARWVEVIEDMDGNIKPHKGKGDGRKRIDNIICAVMALNRAMVSKPQEATRSIYESRGILTF